MTSVRTINPSERQPFWGTSEKCRQASKSNNPEVLTDIYHEDTNIAIWQRSLSGKLKNTVDHFLQANPTFKTAMTVSPQSVYSSINTSPGWSATYNELSENIAELVDMFCYLFDLNRAAMRLAVLQHAMCPKFHVDRVPCRLVTTYQGIATEWLPHEHVNRSKLGMGSNGKPDNESGLYQSSSDIEQLFEGDVALLKGELWEGNENAGLVHRSPTVSTSECRLLLTMDFSN